MPNRFSTQAANADIMGEDADGTPEGMSNGIGADGTPRDRSDVKPERTPQAKESRDSASQEAETRTGKDGKDGSAKEKDAGKP